MGEGSLDNPFKEDFFQTIVKVGWSTGKVCVLAHVTYDNRATNAGISIEGGEAEDIRTTGPQQVFELEGAVLMTQTWVINFKRFTAGETVVRITCSQFEAPETDEPSAVWLRDPCINKATDVEGVGPWDPEPTYFPDTFLHQASDPHGPGYDPTISTSEEYSLLQTFDGLDTTPPNHTSNQYTRSDGNRDPLDLDNTKNPFFGLNAYHCLNSRDIVPGTETPAVNGHQYQPGDTHTYVVTDETITEQWVGLNGNMGPPDTRKSSGHLLSYRGGELTPAQIAQGAPFNDGSFPEFPDKFGVTRDADNPLGENGGTDVPTANWTQQTSPAGFAFATVHELVIFNGPCMIYFPGEFGAFWPIARGAYHPNDQNLERKQDNRNNDGSTKTQADVLKDTVRTHLYPIYNVTSLPRIYDPFGDDNPDNPVDWLNDEIEAARDAGFLSVVIPEDWKERETDGPGLFNGAQADDWYGPGGKYFARLYNSDFSADPQPVPDPFDFWEFTG